MKYKFNFYELKLMKVGKILKHTTICSGKSYSKAKLYLKNDILVNKQYDLYDIGNAEIKEVLKTVKGKAIMIFIPNNPREKKDIDAY